MQEQRPAPATHIDHIARRLVQTRLSLGLSQAEFGRRAGIAANTLNQWERAKGRPGLDQALLLCEAFGLTLDWIYRGDPSGLPFRIASGLQKRAS